MAGIGRLKNKITINLQEIASSESKEAAPSRGIDKGEKKQTPPESSKIHPSITKGKEEEFSSPETRRFARETQPSVEENQPKGEALESKKPFSAIPPSQSPQEKTPSLSERPQRKRFRLPFALSQKAFPSTTSPSGKRAPSETGTAPREPLSAKEKLYQQILASSQKENLARQQFIARLEGEAIPHQQDTFQNGNQEKVIFQPVPQKPGRAQKIVTRILIALLLISLGFLIYLIARGYLI